MTSGLTRGAGVCLIAAGTIFVAVQVNHPALTLDTVGSADVLIRSSAKAFMAVLALFGIAVLYARDSTDLGRLGLVGTVIFGIGYVAMFAVESIAAFLLPSITDTSPRFVEDVLAVAVGGKADGDIGLMGVLFGIMAVGYLLGGLLFGIALFRVGRVARWAAALLAGSTAATIALAVLPESFNRPFAVPTGIALAGIGWSLWRSQSTSRPGAAAVGARLIQERTQAS